MVAEGCEITLFRCQKLNLGYATHMGWVFEGCVFLLLSLPLKTFYEFYSNFHTQMPSLFVFTVQEPCLRPCTPSHNRNRCRRVENHAIPMKGGELPGGCAFALVLRYPQLLGL